MRRSDLVPEVLGACAGSFAGTCAEIRFDARGGLFVFDCFSHMSATHTRTRIHPHIDFQHLQQWTQTLSWNTDTMVRYSVGIVFVQRCGCCLRPSCMISSCCCRTAGGHSNLSVFFHGCCSCCRRRHRCCCCCCLRCGCG